jgi:ribosome maturation factor RimP
VDDLEKRLSALLEETALELVDLEVHSGLVRVVVDRPGGVDVDALSEANRTVSAELDRLDPLPGRYTLEVSSPGLERPLRTPAHFSRAIGSEVTLRTAPGTAEHRRVTGTLLEATEEGVVVKDHDASREVALAYHQIERARTVFSWGPAPRPGKGHGAKAKAARATTTAPAGAKRPARTRQGDEVTP